MTIHPLLQEGDVIASGIVYFADEDKPPRPYHLTYGPNRGKGRVVCPRDSVDTLKRLGFTIEDHWIRLTHLDGHRGVSKAHFHYGARPLSPNTESILKGGPFTNQQTSFLLSKEVDL